MPEPYEEPDREPHQNSQRISTPAAALFDSIVHFFADPHLIIQDIESAPHVPDIDKRVWLDAVLDYANASGMRRAIIQNDLPWVGQMFTVIFGLYRPAPALKSHVNVADHCMARVNPGGVLWRDVLRMYGYDILTSALNAVRLDDAFDQHQGSGTIMTDSGEVLTAMHVINGPGRLIEKNFSAAPHAVANAILGCKPFSLGLRNHVAQIGNLDACWLSLTPKWDQIVAQHLGANVQIGLPRQTVPLPSESLKGRLVVVIGHPGGPSSYTNDGSLASLFNDAPPGTKRIMPGMLHPTEPLVWSEGGPYLRHDCSTLGGASGSCLIDLETGVVLGVHVSGRTLTENRNRAVPAWLIP